MTIVAVNNYKINKIIIARQLLAPSFQLQSKNKTKSPN